MTIESGVEENIDFKLRFAMLDTDTGTVEQRLITLEQAVLDLQHKVDAKPYPENWLDGLVGSISDDSAFLEALEYGRLFRQSEKFIDENNKKWNLY